MDNTFAKGMVEKTAMARVRRIFTRAGIEFIPKGCIVVYNTDEWPDINPEYFCMATPLGENWPQCYKKKGHEERGDKRHESIDQWWDDENPISMKRY